MSKNRHFVLTMHRLKLLLYEPTNYTHDNLISFNLTFFGFVFYQDKLDNFRTNVLPSLRHHKTNFLNFQFITVNENVSL